MIPVPGFMNLTYKLILTLEWYNTDLQPRTYIFLAKMATKLLNFAPKRGLAWMVLCSWEGQFVTIAHAFLCRQNKTKPDLL